MHHSPPRVFVVDDDHSVRKALGRLLRAAGYETELFEAAEAYLARAAPEPPACLLLDIRMPGMTGLELQRAIEGTPMELPRSPYGLSSDVARRAVEGPLDLRPMAVIRGSSGPG
jgi:FixJ family two-component response regulator